MLLDVVPVASEPEQPCGCPVTLLVVHPDARVRTRLLAAAPTWLLPIAVARPVDLDLWLHTLRHPLGVVVVALDPARTPALVVRRHLPAAGVHLLSVSDLQHDAADPAVDSVLPRRRLTRATLLRHLRAVGVLDPSCGTSPATRLAEIGATS